MQFSQTSLQDNCVCTNTFILKFIHKRIENKRDLKMKNKVGGSTQHNIMVTIYSYCSHMVCQQGRHKCQGNRIEKERAHPYIQMNFDNGTHEIQWKRGTFPTKILGTTEQSSAKKELKLNFKSYTTKSPKDHI